MVAAPYRDSLAVIVVQVPKAKATQWCKSKGVKVCRSLRRRASLSCSKVSRDTPSVALVTLSDPERLMAVGLVQAIPYFETSAKDATRVEAAFVEAAQLALQQTSHEKDE